MAMSTFRSDNLMGFGGSATTTGGYSGHSGAVRIDSSSMVHQLQMECDHRNRMENSNRWMVDYNTMRVRLHPQYEPQMQAVMMGTSTVTIAPGMILTTEPGNISPYAPKKSGKDLKNLIAYYYNRKR